MNELTIMSKKLAGVLALLDAMTDDEVMDFSNSLNLHIATRFKDSEITGTE